MKKLILIFILISSFSYGQQFARPNSDLDNTGVWTPSTGATLFGVLDDVWNTDFTDWLNNDGSASISEPFTVKLSSLIDPETSIDHVLKYSIGKDTGGAVVTVTIELRQDYVNESNQGTLIRSHVPIISYDGPGPTLGSNTLSTGETNLITDYSNLYIRAFMGKNGGGANRTVRFFDFELEVPNPPSARRIFNIN